MADKMTPEQRHFCMSRIRSKNTKPELLVRKYLFAHGFRFRIHVNVLPGKPDIVLRKYKTVIFVNGCFWHGHEDCDMYSFPKSNVEFWKNKIERNKERDLRKRIQLRRMNWHVIVLWECQLKPKKRANTLAGLTLILNHLFLKNKGNTVNFYEEYQSDSVLAAEASSDYAIPHQEIKNTKR